MNEPVIELCEVELKFPVGADWRGRPKAYAHALNGLNLRIKSGETIGVVGESGCGKSTLAMILLGLVQPTNGKVIRQVESASSMQIVFQDPQSSLNTRMPIWRIITEPIFAQARRSKNDLRTKAAELAKKVGLRPEVLDRFPHEFSGGQRQRIAIARALSSDPKIIVLDEPTSALDISVQAQILNLLDDLKKQQGLTYIFISHDISVIRHMCDRVVVMYLGQIVEIGDCEAVLDNPRHPYTKLLLESVPKMEQAGDLDASLENTELPSNRNLPLGCFFLERCSLADEACGQPQVMQNGVRCNKFSK